jgi:hypothetical protein
MDNFNATQVLYCKFCGKECKSLNSLKQHEIRCNKNPNKLIIDFSKRSSENASRKGINKGKRWINNGVISKWVKPELLPDYLNKGWLLGMDDNYKQKLSNVLKGKPMGKCLDPKAEEERKRKISESMKGNTNWMFNKTRGNSKKGWYKGIFCDSTWELAFVVYYKEHNLYIERCKEKREYIWKNEKHIYYPDFITDDGIIEIKGYKVKGYKEKQIYNPDIKVLYYEDIKDILTYVRNKYGNNFWEILYE